MASSPYSNASSSTERPSLEDIEKLDLYSATDTLLEESDQLCKSCKHHHNASRVRKYFALGIAIALWILTFFAGVSWERSKLELRVFERSSVRSPIKKDISPETKLVKYNGTLDFHSQYRGRPRPELDAAWEKWENVGFFSISKQDVMDMGASLDAIQLPEKYGGGYMATAESSHKMHCLNFIRRSLFVNYDYYKDKSTEFKDPPNTVRLHLEHCVEIFRQDVQCQADPGVLTAHWLKGYPRPYANFNMWKVCRNWDELHEWAASRAFEPPNDGDWKSLMVPGAVEWEHPPQPSQFVDPPPFP